MILDKILKVRKDYAYGEQYDYFDDKNIVGFTRTGDNEHINSGIAVLMTDSLGGTKMMNVGKKLAGCTFYDCTGNIDSTVSVDVNGNGIFSCKDGSVSIWIKK